MVHDDNYALLGYTICSAQGLLALSDILTGATPVLLGEG